MDTIITQSSTSEQPSPQSLARRDSNMQRRKSAGLGNPAEKLSASKKDANIDRYKLLRKAQRIAKDNQMKNSSGTDSHRIIACQCHRAHQAEHATIYRSQSGQYSFGDVQTCGNAWFCPVCSAKILAKKRDEIEYIIEQMTAQGYTPVMFTLTASHHKNTILSEFMHAFDGAYRYMSSGRAWRTLTDKHRVREGGINRYLYRNEVTWGQNGWHYHRHWLMFLHVDTLNNANLADLEQKLGDRWLNGLQKYGLSGIRRYAFKMSATHATTAQYLSKMGLDASPTRSELEMTASNQKSSSRTIFDLIDLAQNDTNAEALVVQFAEAIHNKAIIRYGNGLADCVALDEMDEQDASEDTSELEPFLVLKEIDMKAIRFWGAQAQVLICCHNGIYSDLGHRAYVRRYLAILKRDMYRKIREWEE